MGEDWARMVTWNQAGMLFAIQARRAELMFDVCLRVLSSSLTIWTYP